MTDLPPAPPGWPHGDEWMDTVAPAPVPPVRRRASGVVAIAVAVVVLLVAGVSAVTALTGQNSNTPEDAVRGLLTAAGNGDVLGLLGHLDPGERDAISGFLTGGTADLKRLGILSSSTDLHHISGVGVTFDNLTTTTTDLRPGLAAVKITSGTVRSHVDPSKLPLGPVILDHARAAIDRARPTDRTAPFHLSVPIVTVRRDGTWYVSLGYTAAEALRAKSGAPLPAPQDAVPAVGADSPTAAVDAFIRAIAAFDARRVIELTPPDEAGALHDYAPLFLPNVDHALAKAHLPSVTVTDLQLSAAAHPGGQLVKVTRLGVRATLGQTTYELAPGTKCITVTPPPDNDFPGECGAHNAMSGLFGSASGVGSDAFAPFKSLAHLRVDAGIVVVERDGRWFVSVLRTGLDDLGAVLHAITPEIVQSISSAFSPAGLLGLAMLGGMAHSRSVSTPPSTFRPTISRCVNGMRTITLSPGPGQPARPPITVRCAMSTP
jgi:hypothetical protein